MSERGKAISVLTMNTLAFTVCFAVWMMNGVLITFLVDNRIYDFDKVQMGWLIGIPVLTGSIFRLPLGLLTDKYGGRPVFTGLMLVVAAASYLVSFADSFWSFLFGGLAFGLAGTSFAVGIAYTSVWFPRHQQGTALGIFGAGNAGAAITSMVAPWALRVFTNGGAETEGWRMLPRVYAGVLLVTAVAFFFLTFPRKVEEEKPRTLLQRLEPLKRLRVWRFGLYYFLVFGGFVALAQWLIPYYVNVYVVSIATAGLLASIFTLPSGVIRALGGWLSDKFGARTVMYWVLGGTGLACLLLIVPRMDIYSPGEGVMARAAGRVELVDEKRIVVSGTEYKLVPKPEEPPKEEQEEGTLIWPTSRYWQEPIVEPGQEVKKKELIARGYTHIYFQANIWVFTFLVFVVGILMGIGKAAVYKHIPEYFPNDIGAVGGLVGVLGGLGGFVSPIVFGYLLKWTGLWTTCWMFLFGLSVLCLVWMHVTIRRMMAREAPDLHEKIDHVLEQAGLEPEAPVRHTRPAPTPEGAGALS